MPVFGVYPIADAWPGGPGSQISSTGEARHVTVLESDLIHPVHAGGIVDKGDPVVIGANATGRERGVGVALAGDANTVATDLIAVDTEGLWNLDVFAQDDVGPSAVEGTEQLYINVTNAVISKIENVATQIPFGLAYGHIDAGATEAIAVKVHHDPPDINGPDRIFKTVTSGDFGLNLRTTLAGGTSEGVGGYVEAHLTALQTGLLYGFGSWINVDAINLLAAGQIVTPFEGGIWAGTAQAAARVVFAGQHQAILVGAPASLHAWRLNVAAAGGAITALIAAANPTTVGWVAGAGVAQAKTGNVPMFDIVGPGIAWVRCYAGAN